MANKKQPKGRTVNRKANALNIAIDPHPKGRYVELFRTAFSKKTEFSFFGTRTGCITFFRKEEESDHLFRGILAIFSSVNFNRAWLNIETGDVAEEDEVDKIRIPDKLRPEFTKVPFVFDANKHLMVYFSAGLGVKSARNLIEGLFVASGAIKEDDELTVTIVQDEYKLDEMLKEPGIKEIQIEIDLPNADDLSQVEKDLYDRLKKQNAKSITETYEADSKNNLMPDKTTRALGSRASGN